MKILLEYTFIIDPSDGWMNLSQFEADLGKFFREHGFDAEIINYGSDRPNKKVVYIKKSDTFETTVPEDSKSIKQIKADLTRGRGYDGKFTK